MKSYFNFNRKEKIGVITLSAIILFLVIVLNVGNSSYVNSPIPVDQSKLNFITINQHENFTQNQNGNKFVEHNTEDDASQLHDFDPNTIQLKEWENLGFSLKQAQSIVTYRERFGPFERKEDLKKIYVISNQKYAEIEPFIKIQQDDITSNSAIQTPKTEKVESIELNAASLEQLMTLRGIGEGYGSRIINYRNKIGGYIDFDQVDALSISDDAKSILKEYVTIDPEKVNKTNVNTATKDELKAVPFSNWLLVSSILKQRELTPLVNLNFLTEKEISQENRIKFEHYISF